MNGPTRRLEGFAVALATFAVIASVMGWGCQPVGADSSSFWPAYFEPDVPPRITLFPPIGQEVSVALPGATNMRIIAFSPDGKAIYGQKEEPLNSSMGVYKIEFQPPREIIVPGSAGLGKAQCLAVSPSSSKMIVVVRSWNGGTENTFEIDPSAGTSRPLPRGAGSRCWGFRGSISPDGKRFVSNSGKHLSLVDNETGAVRIIKGIGSDTRCAWAPNGRWIAGVENGKISLIDVDDTSRPRNLGVSGHGPVEWSPDSQYLLVRRSQLSCVPTLYGESLQTIDISTGKRTLVGSSHCRITSGVIGWMDRGILQSVTRP